MGEDFFLVDIPIFIPAYEADIKYGWSKYKDNLWEVLRKTTGGYCMYCYDTVWINGQRRGQIEHGIEKVNSVDYLTDCVPNLGLACGNCNNTYKKRGEIGRKVLPKNIKEFEKGNCKKFDCKAPCEKFEILRADYIKNGKILIQPFEMKSGKEGHSLRMQYDLLRCQYIPSKNHGSYDEEELEIITKHIKLFELNSPERKNREVGKFCKNVIDNQCMMEGYKYDNLIVDLFQKKLKKLNLEEAIKICEIVYGNAWIQLAT